MNFKYIGFFLFGAVCFTLFQNCSARHESWEASSLASINQVNTQLSIQAFEKNLQPIMLQNCAGCHGVNQQPLHSVSDAASAHDIIMSFGLVNIVDPSQSRLVTKISGGHASLPTTLSDEILNAIQAWADEIGNSAVPTGQITATFSSINELILQPKCVSCHNPTGIRPSEDYTDYVTTINTGKVVPFDAVQSELYTQCVSGEMPQDSTRLTDAELAAIRTWIDNGALNN